MGRLTVVFLLLALTTTGCLSSEVADPGLPPAADDGTPSEEDPLDDPDTTPPVGETPADDPLPGDGDPGDDPDPGVEPDPIPVEPEPNPADGDVPCAIAETLEASCGSCHGAEPRFGAPMSLVTLADLHAPAPSDPTRSVQELIPERLRDDATPMPPSPNPRLDDAAATALVAWLEGGAPGGDACQPDDPNQEPDPGEIDPGEPSDADCDYKVEMRAHAGQEPDSVEGYRVPNDNNHYECFAFEAPWDEDEVHGLWFRPLIDDERVIHHWLLYADEGGGPADGSHRGCGGRHEGMSMIAGWAPGGTPWELPPNVGLEMPRGSDGYFVLEVHYNNSAGHRDATDRSGVELCATRNLREHTAATHWLGSELILLLGAGEHEVKGNCTPRTQEPVHIVNSWPHMHRRGRHLQGIVHRAGGGQETFIDVPFEFENQVGYSTPVTIEPGDRIETICRFENDGSVAFFGPNTENEMCYNFVIAYPAGGLVSGPGATGARHSCLY